jgi:hypothetical protein
MKTRDVYGDAEPLAEEKPWVSAVCARVFEFLPRSPTQSWPATIAVGGSDSDRMIAFAML